MTNRTCMKCLISGRVQGVWFRASAQEEAETLGIVGIARNLADGRVEVQACGNESQLEKFYEWLQHGPKLAQVEDIIRESMPWKNYDGFKTE